MLVLLIGLMAIGFCGTFLDDLIKAVVSQQRKDTSAVQFMCNPGVLKRIGGLEYGSEVRVPGVNEVGFSELDRLLKKLEK